VRGGLSLTLPSPQFSTAGPTLLSPPITRKEAKTHPSSSQEHADHQSTSHHPEPLKTRLAMSSMISYFNDRILSPEMMRAMIILYIGPHSRPDFSQDYVLSPILAPDSLLSQFPKTYFLTGERDPLVDDTVIFAGRIRRAKAAKYAEEGSSVHLRKEFDDRDVVEVALIPGISHGFLQFVGVFPEGWRYIHRCSRWIEHIFAAAEERELNAGFVTPGGYGTSTSAFGRGGSKHHLRRESSGEEDMGLEMSMSSSKSRRGREGKAGGDKDRESEKKEERKKKERLLREQLRERGEKGKGRGKMVRQKSMVSLASEDDLLGRRMLGLAGPLTGRGEDDD